MTSIKIKTKFETEQSYNNINKIKVFSDTDQPVIFSEEEPVDIKGQTYSSYEAIRLNGNYIGNDLEVTANGYHSLKNKIEQEKKIPLYIDVNVTPTVSFTDQILNITNLDTVDVSNYKTAQIADPNLIPENIAFGCNILGVTGRYVNDYLYASYPQLNVVNLLHNNYCARCLFKTDDRTNFDFLNTVDFSHITDTTSMFEDCKNLTVAPLLTNLHNVIYMDSMFKGCTSLTTLSQLNTSRAITLNYLFDGCVSLSTAPTIDASSAHSLYCTFQNCSELRSINLVNTSNITDMRWVFKGCTNLTTVTQLDTSNATSTERMFNNCSSLTSIPQLNTSKVKNMDSMFAGCTSLTSIPQLDTSNVTDIDGLFDECQSLISIKLNTNNLSHTNTWHSTFNHCFNLRTIDVSFLTPSQIQKQPVGLYYLTFGYCHSLENLIVRNTLDTFSVDRSWLDDDVFYECYKMLGDTNSEYNPSGKRSGRIYIPLTTWLNELPITGTDLLSYEPDCLLFPLEKYTVDGTTQGELSSDITILNRYSVRFRCDSLLNGYVFYSLDDGATWLDLYNVTSAYTEGNLHYKVLYDITNIKFKFVTSSDSQSIKLTYAYNYYNQLSYTVSAGSTTYDTTNKTLTANPPMISIKLV